MICRKCSIEKPDDAFSSSALLLRQRCRACVRAYDSARRKDPEAQALVKSWKAKNFDKLKVYARRKQLKRYGGFTLDGYDSLFIAQSGRCAICRRPPARRVLDVDHCHRTGRVRGLLCNPCNKAIGYMRDNTATALAAAAYLESHQTIRLDNTPPRGLPSSNDQGPEKDPPPLQALHPAKRDTNQGG